MFALISLLTLILFHDCGPAIVHFHRRARIRVCHYIIIHQRLDVLVATMTFLIWTSSLNSSISISLLGRISFVFPLSQHFLIFFPALKLLLVLSLGSLEEHDALGKDAELMFT